MEFRVGVGIKSLIERDSLYSVKVRCRANEKLQNYCIHKIKWRPTTMRVFTDVYSFQAGR